MKCLYLYIILVTVSGTDSIPTIPKFYVYQVRSEVSFVNQSMSRSMIEYNNITPQQWRVTITQNKKATSVIYDHDSAEVFFITDTTCEVRKDQKLPQFDDGTGILFNQKLKFAQSNGLKYMDSAATIRGITCDHFKAVTANGIQMDFYFTAGNWRTSGNLPAVPVRVVVTNAKDTIYYDYYQFIDAVSAESAVFQTPISLYCPNRKKTKPIPKLPPSFHFTLQNVEAADDVVDTTQIWYDQEKYMVRVDKYGDFSTAPYFIQDPIVEIQDYVSGVVYAINQVRGNCTILPMGDFMTMSRGSSNKSYAFPNAEQFLHLDEDFTYIGQRVLNDIEMDVYQAKGVGVEYNRGYHSIDTVYFTPKLYEDLDGAYKMIPYLLVINTQYIGVTKMFINGFSTKALKSSQLDFSSCWSDDDTLRVRILFPDMDPSLAENYPISLSTTLRWYLSNKLSISPLRISESTFRDRTYIKESDSISSVKGVYAVLDIFDRVPSINKFVEIKNASVQLRQKSLIIDINLDGCAEACEDAYVDDSGMYQDETGFYCAGMVYCEKNQECTLYERDDGESPSNPATDSSCIFRQRTSRFTDFTEPKLSTTFSMLNNLVQTKSFKLDLNVDFNGTKEYLASSVTEDDQRSFNVTEDYDLQEFKLFLPKKKLLLQFGVREKFSLEQCATECVNHPTALCPTFSMCYTTGLIGRCTLGVYYPDVKPDSYTDGQDCTLYIRKYSSWFEELPGHFASPASGNRFTGVPTVEDCAEQCYTTTNSSCDIFYYNPVRAECWTSKALYVDLVSFNGTQTQHLGFTAYVTKHKLYFFEQKVGAQITDKQGAMLTDATAEECAETCRKLGYHFCRRFTRTADGTCRFSSNPAAPLAVDSNSTLYTLKFGRSSHKPSGTVMTPLPGGVTYQRPTPGTVPLNVLSTTAFNLPIINPSLSPSCQNIPQPDGNQIQFKMYKQDNTVKPDDKTKADTVSDCMYFCLTENTFQCESLSYCPDSGDCRFSQYHPDLNKKIFVPQAECQVYARNYASEYIHYPGTFVPGTADHEVGNIPSPEICAKTCTEEDSFTCRSFDYCPDSGQCMTWKSHDQEHSSDPTQLDISCSHYSRNYLTDFQKKANRSFTKDVKYELHIGLDTSQCATACVEEEEITCKSFVICSGWNQCRLLTVHPKTDSNVGVITSSDCDLYTREYYRGGGGGSSIPITTDGYSRSTDKLTDTGGYSTGTISGVGIGLLLVGILMGLISYHLVKLVQKKRSDDMEMNLLKH